MLEVAVAAPVWYVTPTIHDPTPLHTTFEVSVAACDTYAPTVEQFITGEHIVSVVEVAADIWYDCPETQEDTLEHTMFDVIEGA